jgi:hypothetical protein
MPSSSISPVERHLNGGFSMAEKKRLPALKGKQVPGKKADTVKGGKVMANAHEMKKALINNFPR